MSYRADDPLIVGFAAAQATMDIQQRRIERLEEAIREFRDAHAGGTRYDVYRQAQKHLWAVLDEEPEVEP